MSSTFLNAGASLHSIDTGSGTPVVFLHPTPLDHNYWRPLVERLRGIRAIVPDFRGHGASQLGSTPPAGLFSKVPDAPVLTMNQYARDVLALLEHLSIERAIFAGCSIGGYVMLEIWRLAPQRMQALAFICSKPQPDAEPALAKRADNITKARAEGVRGIFDATSQSLVAESTRKQRPQIVEEVRAQMTVSVETFIAVQAGLATRPDSVPTVSTINVPVFALAGAEDPAVSAQDMEAFRAAPGGCAYHLLQDAGHFAAYEHPDTVAHLLQPWLDAVSWQPFR